MMSDPKNAAIIKSEANGQGTVSIVAGDSYFTQPVTLTVRNPDGTTVAYRAEAYFILENGEWRFVSTDEPK